ncbi:hypothetical protein O6H91_06G022300 [Diphasiastrum complanatum]|uniref:Uncharacterized protein n=1 Tax=Diphasiastrum complanatum TaxID=34168 RepID=A0ACC2DBW5_DIPCM|nr:hypothetical protein O6H91_06G022300 [Diphasiastrum complanatum]
MNASLISPLVCANGREEGPSGLLLLSPAVTSLWLHRVQGLPTLRLLCGLNRPRFSRQLQVHSLFIHSHSRLGEIARVGISFQRKRGHQTKFCSLGKNDKDIISQLELEKSNLPSKNSHNGIYLLLLLNLGMYVADHWLKLEGVKSLYLYHSSPSWYQFVTAQFCHVNWGHLSSNLFFMYIFGKLVEEEGGSFGLWTTYIITGIGANIVSWLLLPPTVVSVGASGAVFGLFTVGVLIKISLDWRKLLEVLILGQFVVEKVMEAARSSAQMGGKLYGSTAINHIAHFSGALVGVALIWALSKLPSGVPAKKENLKKQSHDS